MCMRCPDCNGECEMFSEPTGSRSDFVGNNHKSMGGNAGIATAMAFANEFQGDGTPHGHGFVALANAYQYSSLDTIAELLEENIHSLNPAEMVERVTSLMEHLHQEDHFDDSAHQKNIDSLEQEFHMNNFGPPRNQHLSVRPSGLHSATPDSSAWSALRRSSKAVEEDAQTLQSGI